MNNSNILPKIDFNYWYNKNLDDSNSEPRFKAMITKIIKIYNDNNNYCQAYFCGNDFEINRLKALNYNQFEDEILSLIRENKSIKDFSDEEILKIFDLIQIWGGLTGGSNPYKIKNNNSTRLGYQSWIKNYRELIIKSIERKVESYDYVLDGNIPYLKMSFGSKHISFWSRKEKDYNCLVVIDNKISGVSGVKIASAANYKLIIENIYKIANELNLMPYQIEKALFTFHKFYFDNSNSKFNKVDINSVDYNVALNLKEVLRIGLNSDPLNTKNNKPKSKRNSTRQQSQYIIAKEEYKKTTNGIIFISKNYISKNKNIEKLLKKNSSININGIEYFEYIGDIANLTIT